jgi:hypothetical protein
VPHLIGAENVTPSACGRGEGRVQRAGEEGGGGEGGGENGKRKARYKKSRIYVPATEKYIYIYIYIYIIHI